MRVGVRCCLFATDHVSRNLVDVYLVCHNNREGSYVVLGLVEQVLSQLSGTLGAEVKGVFVESQSRSTTWSVFNPVPAADFVQVLVR